MAQSRPQSPRQNGQPTDKSKSPKSQVKPPWIQEQKPPNIKFEIVRLCAAHIRANPGKPPPDTVFVPRDRAYDFMFLTYNDLGSMLDSIMKFGPFDGLKEETIAGMDIEFTATGTQLSVGYGKQPTT
jgi:hypothetical protein